MRAANRIKMKNRGLVISSILLFIIVNLKFLWNGTLGFFAILKLFLFISIYLFLIFLVVRQIFILTKEKILDKNRIISIGTAIFFLILTLLTQPYSF